MASSSVPVVKHVSTYSFSTASGGAPPLSPAVPAAAADPNGWKDFLLSGELAENDWVQQLDLDGAKQFINFGQNKAPPKILLLYGSLRSVSYSKKLCYEFARVLTYLGADCRVFNPRELPMADPETYVNHEKVKELRDLSEWSEGQVWVSPEQHGAITGVMKTQIDWIPLSLGSVRPTQGRTLAVAQVSGGSQSFNVVNTLRLLGRWMRMITIPNQSSVPKAWTEFEANGRMKESDLRARVVDVCEELFKFTILTRDHADALVGRGHGWTSLPHPAPLPYTLPHSLASLPCLTPSPHSLASLPRIAPSPRSLTHPTPQVDRYSEREEIKEKSRLLSQAEKEALKNAQPAACPPPAPGKKAC